ncbi:MAG: hypothetical protein LBV06_01975 [Propionibacteriaceae bacterium]|nr:hypothetical protein [Propionibacteriaceae bacterium]
MGKPTRRITIELANVTATIPALMLTVAPEDDTVSIHVDSAAPESSVLVSVAVGGRVLVALGALGATDVTGAAGVSDGGWADSALATSIGCSADCSSG